MSYAKTLRAADEAENAIRACSKALAIREGLDAPDPRDLGNTRLLLAELLVENEPQRARSLARQAAEDFANADMPDEAERAIELVERLG